MFQKNNTLRKDGKSGIKKGQKQPKTILREKLGLNGIEDLKQKTLENFNEFLEDENPNLRIIATKETAKYLFSTKQDANISGTLDVGITVKKFID